jgi:hypothetical protein
MFSRRTLTCCPEFALTRRQLLRAGLGMLGLSLPEWLGLRRLAQASGGTRSRRAGGGRARACIVFFCWGGVSQLETWDPKPEAPSEYRGDYRSIATAVPGIRLGEYLPLLARQTHRLALVRSVHHQASGHRNAAYWNLTGHPPMGNVADDSPKPPSRRDWPCLGAMVARFRRSRAGMPGAVCLPYPLADRGLLNGQDAGFLGMGYDPLLIRPERGRPYEGVSPTTGAADLHLPADVDPARMRGRLELLARESASARPVEAGGPLDHYRQMAADLLLSPQVSAAFELEREPPRVRAAYGDHICGQSALLARRLTEAGVPIVAVYASAGDLNSGVGDHWDTHSDNFRRLRERLLPPLERASCALLDDLAARGRLEETLVVWLTEFGRTPRLNRGAGRDHFPNCYSVAFAGGGVRGGQVFGRSDRTASAPVEHPCGPHDLHATIFHALGIPPDSHLTDSLGRPMALTDGLPLPLFG